MINILLLQNNSFHYSAYFLVEKVVSFDPLLKYVMLFARLKVMSVFCQNKFYFN